MKSIKYFLLLIVVTIISAKEIVVITDISAEPTQNGYTIVDKQLTELLNFNFDGNTYLQFGDKITMAYIDNSAENAAPYFPDPIFDLSENKFEDDDNYLDNYYANAGEYIDSMINVEKQKVKLNTYKETIESDKLQDVLFVIDRSNSMKAFKDDVRKSIDIIIQYGGMRKYDTLESNGNQLSNLLHNIKPTKLPKQLILFSDGIDDTTENIKLLNNIKQSGYTVYPILLSQKWDDTFLSKLSSENKKTYSTQEALKKIQTKTYKVQKTKDAFLFKNYPNIPMIESINEISKHDFLNTNNSKELFIVSSMMQNSENMNFEKYITNDSLKISVDDFVSYYSNIGMLPNLKGHNVHILRVNMGLFKNNKQTNMIDKFWKSFFKQCGAKNVYISASNLKLER